LNWFGAIAPSKPRVVLTHGENEPRRTLAELIQKRYKLKPLLPDMNETVEL
jgi:metallo-beta-lactamase family protein